MEAYLLTFAVAEGDAEDRLPGALTRLLLGRDESYWTVTRVPRGVSGKTTAAFAYGISTQPRL